MKRKALRSQLVSLSSVKKRTWKRTSSVTITHAAWAVTNTSALYTMESGSFFTEPGSLRNRKPETKEEYQHRLAMAFATWKTARVTRMDEGFLFSLENGTIEDSTMLINTGDLKKDLSIIGFAIGSRGVEELYCSGSLSIRPTEPAGDLPIYPMDMLEEDAPPDPAVEAFLKKNRLLFG